MKDTRILAQRLIQYLTLISTSTIDTNINEHRVTLSKPKLTLILYLNFIMV